MKSCSKFLRNLVTTAHFTDRNWVSKSVYSKKKLKNIIRRLMFDLKRKVSFTLFILFNAIIYQLNKAIKSRSKATKLRMRKSSKIYVKLKNLQWNTTLILNFSKTRFSYSSYILSEQKKIALSFGLGQHFPNRSCKNSIYTEFEQFYQRISYNIRHLP